MRASHAACSRTAEQLKQRVQRGGVASAVGGDQDCDRVSKRLQQLEQVFTDAGDLLAVRQKQVHVELGEKEREAESPRGGGDLSAGLVEFVLANI